MSKQTRRGLRMSNVFPIICLVLLESHTSWASSCTPAESIDEYPISPTLEINTLEFPNEHILPTGYNVTIVCTSNFSKENWKFHYYSQPYWIQQFFNLDDYIGDCGGGAGDNEDSKVCTYVIQNTTERDSGNYSCVSYNQISCTLAEVYLEFQEPIPPRFNMDLPLQFNASFGHEANLTCNVSGIPRPVITWFKDGSRVKRSLVREFQGYSMIAFHLVRLNDQGKYWCEANNTEGWNRSSTANMIVFWRPVFSIHPKSAVEFIDDGSAIVTLFCKANGFPRPVIGWLENNTPVISGTVSQNESTSSLVITFNETTEKPIKYRCIARNSEGSTLSEEATLTVARRGTRGHMGPAAFYIDPKSITASLGETVMFSCAAHGASHSNITWLKDGTSLTNTSARMNYLNTQQSSELHIISVSETDIGKYSCLAATGSLQVFSREAELSLKDGTPTSINLSKIIWSSVGVGLLLIIIAVLVILKWQRRKKRKSNHRFDNQVKEEQRLPHLHIRDTTGRPTDDWTTARYQMTNVA